VRAGRSSVPKMCEQLSFQNLTKVGERIATLFGVDLQAAVVPAKWELDHRGFMKRHVLAHRGGVVDQKYLDETHDNAAVLGRRVPLTPVEVSSIADATAEVGSALVRLLPEPTK